MTKGKQDLGRIWDTKRLGEPRKKDEQEVEIIWYSKGLREDFTKGKQDLGRISQRKNVDYLNSAAGPWARFGTTTHGTQENSYYPFGGSPVFKFSHLGTYLASEL